MKVHCLTMAVIAASSFVTAKPLSSAASRGISDVRFTQKRDTAIKHGKIENKNIETSLIEMLPEASQGWNPPLDYALPKGTPGESCSQQEKCGDCTANQLCVWLPFSNECVEDRNPEHVKGTMQCGSWTPDELPVISNEKDDFRLFHTRSDPRDFNIASLNGGQDIFTSAIDVDFPGKAKPLISQQGGGDIIDGLTERQYNAEVLNLNAEGQMLPKGVEGERYPDKKCNCSDGQGNEECECGFLQPGAGPAGSNFREKRLKNEIVIPLVTKNNATPASNATPAPTAPANNATPAPTSGTSSLVG